MVAALMIGTRTICPFLYDDMTTYEYKKFINEEQNFSLFSGRSFMCGHKGNYSRAFSMKTSQIKVQTMSQ